MSVNTQLVFYCQYY